MIWCCLVKIPFLIIPHRVFGAAWFGFCFVVGTIIYLYGVFICHEYKTPCNHLLFTFDCIYHFFITYQSCICTAPPAVSSVPHPVVSPYAVRLCIRPLPLTPPPLHRTPGERAGAASVRHGALHPVHPLSGGRRGPGRPGGLRRAAARAGAATRAGVWSRPGGRHRSVVGDSACSANIPFPIN